MMLQYLSLTNQSWIQVSTSTISRIMQGPQIVLTLYHHPPTYAIIIHFRYFYSLYIFDPTRYYHFIHSQYSLTFTYIFTFYIVLHSFLHLQGYIWVYFPSVKRTPFNIFFGAGQLMMRLNQILFLWKRFYFPLILEGYLYFYGLLLGSFSLSELWRYFAVFWLPLFHLGSQLSVICVFSLWLILRF